MSRDIFTNINNISDYIFRPKKELTPMNAGFKSNRVGEHALEPKYLKNVLVTTQEAGDGVTVQ
jgi:hypothetical protein